MPIIEVNGHRIFEQDEAGSDLSGYDFAVDKTGETEAEKIAAERIVLTGTELDGVNGFQEITGRKYLTNRLLEYQSADIASANNLMLANGRFFRLTGTTELQTINNNGWTGGSWVLIEIKNGTTVKHNAADYGLGNYYGILLAVQADYTATQDIILMLVLDSVANKWKEINGTTISTTALASVVNVQFDHYTHIVTQAEAEGADFTFEVPNFINTEMGIHVYCNQLPLTLNKGYTVDFDNATKEVTILKNNTDETYFAIKAGWPIFVGYYYTKATPGTPENPPPNQSMVTLDGIRHISPDAELDLVVTNISDVAGVDYMTPTMILDITTNIYYTCDGLTRTPTTLVEYNTANDVKFIIKFSNTGSADESLNLHLQLVMSGTGGIIANQDITHSVPVGGNTYEITYKALGIIGSSQEYTLHVSGDRIDNDAVTVPAKTGTITLDLIGASRQTTTTVSVAVDFRNITSIFATKTAYVQLDSGTKIAITQSLGGMNHTTRFHTFADVVDANAHTVTLYDSDQTTVIETMTVAALAGAGSNILGSESIVSHMTAYHPDGTFYRYSNSSMYINDYLEVGCSYGADDLAVREDYNRCSMSIINIPNKPVVANVKIRLIDDPNYPYTFANLDFLQVHVHNKDLRYVQNYYDYHNAYTVNNILTDTEVIEAAVSESGNREYILTLDGNYFENITTGYFGLLIRSTDESLSAQTFTLWIHDITIN